MYTRNEKKNMVAKHDNVRVALLLVLALSVCFALSGCSLRDMKKWFDEMEWERSDRVVQLSDFIVVKKPFAWRVIPQL